MKQCDTFQAEKQAKDKDNLSWVETNMGMTEDGMFRCAPCDKIYPTWGDLAGHVRRVHQIKQCTSKLSTSCNHHQMEVSAAEQEVVNRSASLRANIKTIRFKRENANART